jgi:dipeptidyl aminopeptidase/acylaminoacyl peptidase
MRAILQLTWIVMLLALLVLRAVAASGATPDSKGQFTVDDYFRLQRVVELSLSADGDWLAYVTQVQSLDENRPVRNVFVSSLAAGATPKRIEKLTTGSEFSWIPASRRLAYLGDSGGTPQVFSYDIDNGAIEQLTSAKDPIEQFRFSPDGKTIAYNTKAFIDGGWLYNRFRKDTAGINLDTDTTSSHDFLNPSWSKYFPGPGLLWLKSGSSEASRANVPGDVQDFFWSGDANSLSIDYVPDDSPKALLRGQRTGIGILDIASGRFRELAKSSPPGNGQPGKTFNGGEWVRNERKIVVLRVTETDPWTSFSFPEWSIAEADRPLVEGDLRWHPAETYALEKRLYPLSDQEVLAENTIQGHHTLFDWTAKSCDPAAIVRGLEGSNSLATFSADLRKVAFVNESLMRPPEIFVKQNESESARKVTSLNAAIAEKSLAAAKDVTWTSKDGTLVHGWLIVPASTSHKGPWPLVTMVHGGPGFAIADMFEPYFYTWGGVWPYPFEALAANGIAVFYPNYRGTQTYGKAFASPSRIDGEPADDIIAGVQYLVDTGVADSKRLGIAGQSHGAWLGPLVTTRAKVFRASSFAEGSPNYVTVYELMPGELNREVHDVENGGSLYDSPERYVELSPDLHFAGVQSANLYESGSESQAIFMLGFGKVSRRYGLPTEMIVYPQTGHNLHIPRMQKESAERNLDWFRFWLKDEVDPDPAKAAQYDRWKKMAADWEQASPSASRAGAP